MEQPNLQGKTLVSIVSDLETEVIYLLVEEDAAKLTLVGPDGDVVVRDRSKSLVSSRISLSSLNEASPILTPLQLSRFSELVAAKIGSKQRGKIVKKLAKKRREVAQSELLERFKEWKRVGKGVNRKTAKFKSGGKGSGESVKAMSGSSPPGYRKKIKRS